MKEAIVRMKKKQEVSMRKCFVNCNTLRKMYGLVITECHEKCANRMQQGFEGEEETTPRCANREDVASTAY